jgi:hypothetical protein
MERDDPTEHKHPARPEQPDSGFAEGVDQRVT